MSKNLYDEAIAEAKLLKETAEQNAKNAIIEAVTPKIRSFIEEQLLGDDGSSDTSSILEDVATDILYEGATPDQIKSVQKKLNVAVDGKLGAETKTAVKKYQKEKGLDVDGTLGKKTLSSMGLLDEHVALDESALLTLVDLIGVKTPENVKRNPAFRSAMNESIRTLSQSERKHLSSLANKLKQNVDFLDGNDINNDVHVQQENSRMHRSEEILYEVNLEELAGELSELMGDPEAGDDMEEGNAQQFADEMVQDMEEGDYQHEMVDPDEAVELEEVLRSLGLSNLLNEDKIEIDLGDHELPEDVMISARLVADEEEEVDLEDLESAEEEDEEGEELEAELDAPDDEALQEVFDIDPRVLRTELKRLRQKISEAKDLASIKGIKDTKESSWGGSGSGKAGLKGAYGGTGGGKVGVEGSYGGGKGSGDPLKVKLNKLSEAVKNERRRNRALEGRLNEYRSAVETLREQLTDLNLFNAKLLYVNKLLQNKDVSSSQKRSVVESIDRASSLKEVKLIYKTLTESFSKGGAGVLRESHVRRTLGSSSRMTSRASAETATAEVSRWATLAGIKEK